MKYRFLNRYEKVITEPGVNLYSCIKAFWKLYKNFNEQEMRLALGDYVSSESGNGKERFRDDMKRYLVESVTKRRFHTKNYMMVDSSLLKTWKAYRIIIRTLDKTTLGLAEGLFYPFLEVGLRIDNIFGFPYIPSSTIKGSVRRSYIEIVRKSRNSTNKVLSIETLFGSKDRVGLLVFTDAYLLSEDPFYPDIITPHYKGDVHTELDVKPQPLPHIVIKGGTLFMFHIFMKKKFFNEKQIKIEEFINSFDENDQVNIKDLKPLTKAILYSFARGVGARTSYGYSRFEVLSIKEVK